MSSATAKQGSQRRDPQVRFNKYESIRRIAIGGMAEIYLARAKGIEGFEKLVVLKRILPQFAANEEFVRMFLDEGRLASTLHHPNIGQVTDIGMSNGQYFLVMEFLHGVDVRRLLRRCLQLQWRLPLEHAVAIAIGMCAGLHHAHEQVGLDGKALNLVHRDVSPQNVFVTYDGAVKLLDFGVAKAAHRVQETQGSSLKGKISYMSPEQCSGDPIDRRSDIFSVAIVLWEMTLMRRLYKGETEFHILKRVVEKDAPSPFIIDPNYPPELEQIVMRGLKRDRGRRYQTLEEMQLDLEAFARERKLTISQVALGRFMREVFAGEVEAWQKAVAAGQLERAAKSLVSPELANEPDSSPFASDGVQPSPAQSQSVKPGIWVGLAVAGGLLAVALALLVGRSRQPAPLPSPAIDPPAASAAIAPPIVAPAPPAAVVVAAPTATGDDAPKSTTAPKRISPPKKRTLHHASRSEIPARWDPESITPP
ncbi:MAG TPA: serine/threonine-protein kinase [Polyangia bacterium]|nr:serine/threonine-protein kinase [Polyangia bacterium]